MKLFNRELFNNATFNVGAVRRLFNKDQFQTQPFNTGEPITKTAMSEYYGGHSSQTLDEYVFQTNNVLTLCAAAFVQTISEE